MDEPNAALDAISEYNLSLLYSNILKDKIGLIIAHRFNNFISSTNSIIVMDSGKIVEKGTHTELINIDGIYKKLYELQARND